MVRIRSKLFQTEKEYDYLTIGNTVYSGKTKIDRILSTNFIVGFSSDNKRTDQGFVLNWECLSWGEWTHVDGESCEEEMRPQLEYKGIDEKVYIKYRDINETCGEFINFRIFFIIRRYVIWNFNKNGSFLLNVTKAIKWYCYPPSQTKEWRCLFIFMDLNDIFCPHT